MPPRETTPSFRLWTPFFHRGADNKRSEMESMDAHHSLHRGWLGQNFFVYADLEERALQVACEEVYEKNRNVSATLHASSPYAPQVAIIQHDVMQVAHHCFENGIHGAYIHYLRERQSGSLWRA
ncbi:hypothetical protein BDZ89DRAFT_1134701 [Hymenopellis radicata]|nr:hypothetical protein BDZ89DRAFT_1134701 [Hymenopellis radicata]